MSKLKMLMVGFCLPFIANCGGEETSFSLLSDSDTFTQSAGSINDKIDILWVIDNSGSMATSQQNVADNFNNFIADFENKNLDFRMAVTGTDAFRYDYGDGDTCAEFRDGPVRYNYTVDQCQNNGTHSGYPIITPGTPDLLNTFINSILQGTQGYGDERPLQSLVSAFDHTNNSGFVRNDSFVSVIILTDEDDYSHAGSNNIQGVSYSDPRLVPVSDYADYLDTLTGTSGANRRYNVNTIAILDQACQDLLNTTWTGRRIGVRVGELADLTGGLKTSLCGDFASDLEAIAENILTLATQFVLSRDPIPSTISVLVNGVAVPERNTNPLGDGGWEYDPASNSIRFYGSPYIPGAGSSIQVDFDPVQYGS